MPTQENGSAGESARPRKSSSGGKAPTKAPTSKAPTSKAPTSKAPTSKAAARKAPRAEAPKPAAADRVAQRAVEQLAALCGKEPEGVTGLERTEDGWTVLVDVVELRRVPDTTDVLAAYEVDVDARGNLQAYQRVRRFVRGAAGGDPR